MSVNTSYIIPVAMSSFFSTQEVFERFTLPDPNIIEKIKERRSTITNKQSKNEFKYN